MSLARRALLGALALTLAACSGSSSSSSSSGSTGHTTATAASSSTGHSSSSGAASTSTGSTGESTSASSGSSTASSTSSTASSGASTASSSSTGASTGSSGSSATTSGSTGSIGGSSTGSTGSSGSTGGQGTLTVVINAPSGGSATVQVTGTGFSQALTAGASLQVAAGTYDVTASTVVLPDPIVGAAYAPVITGSPAVVTAGATTTVTIDYPALLPGSGMIWIPDANDNAIVAVDSAQLQAATNAFTPILTLQMNDGGYAEAVAFDRAGQPWAVDDSNTLYSWTLFADGGASPVSQFNMVMVDGGPLGLQSLTFAPNGDLWLPAFTQQTSFILRVTPDQLLTPGDVLPAQILEDVIDDGGFDSVANPYGVAFDATGNAWTVNINTNTIVEFPRLGDGGYDPYPATVIYDPGDGGVFGGLNGIAFDAQGDLWVASSYDNAVVHLSVAGLSGDQPVSPIAIFGGTDAGGTPSLSGTDYASFDHSGALWVWSQDIGTLTKFDNPGQYTGSVTPAPDAFFITPYSGDTGKFAFDPPAPGLHLYP
ncbi:MAG: hypothetical protein JST54_24435 [Deltaproteobacteria bacterium]|nr:hypothetical protein [Deltaproteobacteria bacterium]